MKTIPLYTIIHLLTIFLSAVAVGQSRIEFQKTIGGKMRDRGVFVTQTSDSGYIVAGVTQKGGSGDEDIYLVKTDSKGSVEWSKSYGGPGEDNGWSVRETRDGFIVGGFTNSTGAGGFDFFLLKTDLKGEKRWQRTFGEGGDDRAWDVILSKDGGYVLIGETTGATPAGEHDCLLLKTDSDGKEQWSKTYGGAKGDRCFSMAQDEKGEFIIAGQTYSTGAGDRDMFILKTDSSGKKLWSRTFGGVASDVGHSVTKLSDGGFLVTGYTSSFAKDGSDPYLVKVDTLGKEVWSRVLPLEGYNRTLTGTQTQDLGFCFTGFSDHGRNAGRAAIVLKTRANGVLEWKEEILFTKTGQSFGYTVAPTSDGGCVITGHTTENSAGDLDLLLVKLNNKDRSNINGEIRINWSSNKSFSKGVLLTKVAAENLGKGAGSKMNGEIFWTGKGEYDLSTRMQGLTSDSPDLVPITEKFGFDPKSKAVLYESRTKVNHDANEWMRFVYDGEGRLLVISPGEKWAIWTGDSETENQRKGYSRIVPQLLLQEALKNRQTIRYQGRTSIGNEALDVVNFSTDTNKTISMFFANGGDIFRGLEYLIDHPLLGDTPVRWLFHNYKQIDGVGLLPSYYEVFLGDKRLKHVKITEAKNSFKLADHIKSTNDLKIPKQPSTKSVVRNGGVPARESKSIEKIDENVFLARNIRGGFHALIVEFEKYLMVVDAPAGYHELQQIPAVDWAGEKSSDAVGDRLLHLVKQNFPNKKTKYVVLTHHHSDHAGGIYPFIREGARIIASEETQKVLKRSLGYNFRLNSLKSLPVTKPNLVVVNRKYSVSDDSMRVDIIDVGDNPHSKGMLVVYLPDRRLLYQADLFEPFRTDSNPPVSRLPIMKWFVKWLDRSNLKPEKVFAIHGSAAISKSQIEKVRQLEQQKPQ